MKRILLVLAILAAYAAPSASAADFVSTVYAPLGNCTAFPGSKGMESQVYWREVLPREINGSSGIGCSNRTGIADFNLQGVFRYRVTGTQTWADSTCRYAYQEPFSTPVATDPNQAGPYAGTGHVLKLGPDASGTQTWDWQLKTDDYYDTTIGNHSAGTAATATIVSNYLPPTSGCGA